VLTYNYLKTKGVLSGFLLSLNDNLKPPMVWSMIETKFARVPPNSRIWLRLTATELWASAQPYKAELGENLLYLLVHHPDHELPIHISSKCAFIQRKNTVKQYAKTALSLTKQLKALRESLS